jgi:hypothetical protein
VSSDLIALVVAVVLGTAVVILGLRRDLSKTTRNGLSRLGDPEQSTGTLGLYEGGGRRRRPLSPRERRWMVSFYLLIALTNAVFVALSANDRLIHAGTAGMWTLGAVFLLWKGSTHSSEGPAS